MPRLNIELCSQRKVHLVHLVLFLCQSALNLPSSSATMQKVIRRTVLAEKQAARKLTRLKESATRKRLKDNRNQASHSRKEETTQIKQARFARREDWELGPLAPRRDVGDSKNTYGTISSYRVRGPVLRTDELKEKLKPFGGRYLNLAAGDRAVILEGSDKGKIGKILSIDTKRAECTIQGLNMVKIPFRKGEEFQ